VDDLFGPQENRVVAVAINPWINYPFLTPKEMKAYVDEAHAKGLKVKIYYTKEEHFAAYSIRLSCRINARVGIKKDGTVTAVAGDWLVNTGSGSEAAPHEISVGSGELQLALRCPNWNLRTKWSSRIVRPPASSGATAARN
jgi:hypothetical protein